MLEGGGTQGPPARVWNRNGPGKGAQGGQALTVARATGAHLLSNEGDVDVIEQDLFKQHMPTVSYLRMDGSVPAGQRQGIVDKFNDDPTIDVLLLSTHVGGLGLNLTGADTVIFVEHDWNPMKDRQAMDRAHRIQAEAHCQRLPSHHEGYAGGKDHGTQKFNSTGQQCLHRGEQLSPFHGHSQLLDLMNYSGATAATTNSPLPDPSSRLQQWTGWFGARGERSPRARLVREPVSLGELGELGRGRVPGGRHGPFPANLRASDTVLWFQSLLTDAPPLQFTIRPI